MIRKFKPAVISWSNRGISSRSWCGGLTRRKKYRSFIRCFEYRTIGFQEGYYGSFT